MNPSRDQTNHQHGGTAGAQRKESSQRQSAWKGWEFYYLFQANHSDTSGTRTPLALLGVSTAQRWGLGGSSSFGAGTQCWSSICGTRTLPGQLTCSRLRAAAALLQPGDSHPGRWHEIWPFLSSGISKVTWKHPEKEPGTPACCDYTYSGLSAFTGRGVAHSNIQHASPVHRNKESLLTTAWVPQDLHIYIFFPSNWDLML